ncbi:MAG: glycosyltransferase [Planctomycetota bacterium]
MAPVLRSEDPEPELPAGASEGARADGVPDAEMLRSPKRRPTRPSVLVSTYRQPRELDLVLAALARQSRAPYEVLVCDDGSGERTRSVIDHWRERGDHPIEHVWQVDNGFRKARIMNEAVRRAKGDHLVFIDGDSFPHRNWVEDHVASADGRTVLCGRRVKLGPRLSPSVTRDDIEAGRFDTVFTPTLLKSGLEGDTKRLPLGLRLPRPVARILHPRPRKLMGVNFSMPRDAFVHVNGYDEAWEFHGGEDRDLELRLIRAGIPLMPVLNRAIVFHLHHEERPDPERARELLDYVERSDHVRCTVGYAQYERFDPAT